MNIIVGLIKGDDTRMPVDRYIFEDINVYKEDGRYNFRDVLYHISDWIRDNIDINNDCLVVYVTNIAVTAELIRYCALHKIKLVLIHYNTTSGVYDEGQYIF